jgi:hypothetical protein
MSDRAPLTPAPSPEGERGSATSLGRGGGMRGICVFLTTTKQGGRP